MSLITQQVVTASIQQTSSFASVSKYFISRVNDVVRDYYEEIEAIVNIMPAGWTVQKLTLWSDMVVKAEPSVSAKDGEPQKSLEEREADLEDASYASTRAKLAPLG